VKLVGDKVEYVKFENTAYGQIDASLSHFSEGVTDIIKEWEVNNSDFAY
jgi:hypothetical protein